MNWLMLCLILPSILDKNPVKQEYNIFLELFSEPLLDIFLGHIKLKAEMCENSCHE